MSSYSSASIEKLARLIGTTLLVAVPFCDPAYAADGIPSDSKTFVCVHDTVSRRMAAAHFNRIARERGLPYTAISRGIAVNGSIPTNIRDGLNLDGLQVTDPRPMTAADAVAATLVFAFDRMPENEKEEAEVNYWSDVPSAIKNSIAAREVIVRHLDNLVPVLMTHARPREMLQGVVIAVDERNDRITVRLTSDTTEDFRVQDGLIFNAVHNGDQVELTVENIDGATTIVGLTKN